VALAASDRETHPQFASEHAESKAVSESA
jgi:hypothetical protein